MQLNRAFKYGDGLFETIRISEGKILHLEAHFKRLSKGLETLQMQDQKQPLSITTFQKILNDFLQTKSDVNLRIRITFFRQAGGLYSPQKHDFDYCIESSPLANAHYQLNDKGLQIGVCSSIRLAIDQRSNLKTISALAYVMAGLEKKKKGWDDCLLLNSKNEVAESIAANVFAVKDKQLYTPALSEGCVMGVMRAQVIRVAKSLGITTAETTLSLEQLATADELFLTNAIQGIRWVAALDGKTKHFGNQIAQLLIKELIQESKN